MFVKPGKSEYVIKNPETGKMVHYQFLCHMRDEALPEAKYDENKREVKKTK